MKCLGLPPDMKAFLAAKVDENDWSNLKFIKTWPGKVNMHEEISFDKSGKTFAFYYNMGEVKYDMGVVEDFGGTDIYVRIIEDN